MRRASHQRIAERVAAAAMVPILMAACSNSFSGWRVFGGYDDAVTTIVTMLALMLFIRVVFRAR